MYFNILIGFQQDFLHIHDHQVRFFREFKFNANLDNKYYRFFVIRITHSTYPDMIITSIPKINFNGLACNFGGLMGMWLGLSMIAILNVIYKLIVKIKIKTTHNYFKNNSNQNNIVINYNVKSVNTRPRPSLAFY